MHATGDSTMAMHHSQLTSWVDIEGLSFGHEKSRRDFRRLTAARTAAGGY